MAEAHSKDPKDKDPKEAKGAIKAPPAPRKKDDDEDAVPEKPAAASQKLLATALSRAIVIATVIGSLSYVAGTLLTSRFTLMAGANPTNNFVYRLDRLTGAMQYCSPMQCAVVEKAQK